jgi:hypothetical protein
MNGGPPSFLGCFDEDGELDDEKFSAFVQAGPPECFVRKYFRFDNPPPGLFDETPRVKKKRTRYEQEDPKLSSWYKYYVARDVTSKKALKKFRRRFRLPFRVFRRFIDDARREGWFPKTEQRDAVGREGTPLELLVLGSLRYLGRGWTFDDIEESTGVSEEVHRVFFYDFVKFGSTILFDQWVVAPHTATDSASSTAEFSAAGSPGCFGSADATHIILEKCFARLKNQHIGFKDSHTTRAFNLTVNHRRRILSTTRGCPGGWNDKTLILFDDFLRGLHEGNHLQVFLCPFSPLSLLPCIAFLACLH